MDRPAYIPSPDEVAAAQSGVGGWNRETLATWGVSWPPPKGWRQELDEAWRAQQAHGAS